MELVDDLFGQLTAQIRQLSARVSDLERQEQGNMIQDSLGNPATIFPFGELNAEERHDDVSVQFQYDYYNTEFDLKPAVISGSATATVADGYLSLVSTGADSVVVESKNAIRYRPGHSGYAQFTAVFIGDGEGIAGPAAIGQDGFYIKLNNNLPYIGYLKAGVEVQHGTTGGYFPDGQIPLAEIDWSKMNIFRVLFGYLGVANPVFQIKIGGLWRVLGTIQTEGLLTGTHIENPVLPIGVSASGNMTIRTASWNGGKLGNGESIGARGFSGTFTGTLSGTNLLTLGTWRNRATFHSAENRVRARMIRYHFFVDAPASGVGTVEVKIIKNPAVSGTPSWTNVDTNNSIMEYDTTATYSSGGRELLVDWLGYSASPGGGAKDQGDISADADSYGLSLLPEETAMITAQNVDGNTAVNVRVAFNWIELF